MLDDGQAQAGAADGLGVALVHPVEPLEHPLPVLRGDADARVGHGHGDRIRPVLHPDERLAAGAVVLDGVVAQVVHHLLHHRGQALDGPVVPGQRQLHLVLPGGGLEAVLHGAGQVQQIDLLPLQAAAPLVQPGQVENVLHQADEPLALLVDVGGEAPDVLLLHQTVLHDLGHAGDGGEGGLQLVGHVGGELPAHLLRLLPLGDVQQHQHRAGRLPVPEDRVAQQLEDAAGPLHAHLAAASVQHLLHQLLEDVAAVQGEDAGLLGGGGRPQQPQDPGVVGQNPPPGVQEQEALGHVLGEGGELLLLLAQLVHLGPDGVVLPADAGEQRGQLVIDLAVLRPLQIQLQDGPDQPLGQPGGQGGGEDEGDDQDEHNGRGHGHQQVDHRALAPRQPDHRPVVQPVGHIDGQLGQGGRLPPGRPLTSEQGLLDLLPVGVVLHGGGVGLVVIEDRPVLGHPGDPVVGPQAVQIVQPHGLHSPGHQPGLGLQLLGEAVGKILVQHAQEQGRRQQQHPQAHRHGAAEDLLCHSFNSPRLQKFAGRPAQAETAARRVTGAGRRPGPRKFYSRCPAPSRCSRRTPPASGAGCGCARPPCGWPRRTHSPRWC